MSPAATVAAPVLTWNGRHEYFLDGAKIDGVTTLLNKALPKSLTQWASDAAANYALEHWDELATEPITRRLDRIRYAHKDVLSSAALKGTTIHRYGEALVRGEPVEADPEYLGPARAYARFLERWKIEPVAIETPVFSPRYGYGGRADLWGTVGVRGNARALIDLKTGKAVYESAVLQCAAYRHADLWMPDGTPASTCPLPEVDVVYVAHIRGDDVDMRPITAGPDEFRAFLYVQQTAHWLGAHGYKGPAPLIGEAERP